jgi:hypothetical protein
MADGAGLVQEPLRPALHHHHHPRSGACRHARAQWLNVPKDDVPKMFAASSFELLWLEDVEEKRRPRQKRAKTTTGLAWDEWLQKWPPTC